MLRLVTERLRRWLQSAKQKVVPGPKFRAAVTWLILTFFGGLLLLISTWMEIVEEVLQLVNNVLESWNRFSG